MPSVTITLSRSEKAFVDAHVKAGGLRSAGEYIGYLIQVQQLQKHRDKIDKLLLDGINSGSTPWTKQDMKEIEKEALVLLARERKNAEKNSKKQRGSKRSA